MKSVDFDWVKTWAAKADIDASKDRLLFLSYREPSQKRIIIIIDRERTPAALVLLANRLVWTNNENEESLGLSDEDQTYIFWIRESGIWGDINEAIAAECFGTLLKGYGQEGGTKGVLFGKDDSRAAVVFVLLTILFGWDAYLVPLSGLSLWRISHDGYVDLRARSETTLKQLYGRLSAWGAEVTEI